VETLALPLEPTPRSVQAARRWVVDVCAHLGRPDLEESAALGVSELVSNALLHAAPPLAVRVGGTRGHPRIEVHDGSRTPPTPPVAPAADLGIGAFLGDLADLGDLGDLGLLGDRTDMGALADAEATGHDGPLDPDLHAAALLSTQGRGLGIVARVAAAWGADVLASGKVVWFEPVPGGAGVDAGEPAAFATTEDVADAPDPADDAPAGPLVTVHLRDVPVGFFAAFLHHVRELRRELRLLALAHESEYPLAKSLSGLLADFEERLAEVLGPERLECVLGADSAVDLTLEVPASTGTMATQVLDLLGLADSLCRAERLLCLPRTPLQRQFQQWLLGELAGQASGLAGTPWSQARPIPDASAS
jgi:hypothetical protein